MVSRSRLRELLTVPDTELNALIESGKPVALIGEDAPVTKGSAMTLWGLGQG